MASEDLQDKPPIKRAEPLPHFARGGGDIALAGLVPVFSALSCSVDLAPKHRDELLNYLHVTLHVCANARSRSWWCVGRYYNRMAQENPDYIKLSGRHLGQVLAVLGFSPPPWLVLREKYLLRADLGEEAYAIMREQAGLAPLKIL